MIGDLLTLSAETVKSVCPDCKDGDNETFSVTGTITMVDGACVIAIDSGSVKDIGSAGDEPAGMAGTMPDSGMTGGGKMSPGVAAMMARK